MVYSSGQSTADEGLPSFMLNSVLCSWIVVLHSIHCFQGASPFFPSGSTKHFFLDDITSLADLFLLFKNDLRILSVRCRVPFIQMSRFNYYKRTSNPGSELRNLPPPRKIT